MPIYEYKCASCGKVSEFMMKMSDPSPEQCPACHKGPLSKLMSQTSFQLAGGGWYSQGYAKGSSGEGAKSSDAAPAASSGDAASKPAADASSTSSSGNKGGNSPAPTTMTPKKD